MAAVGPSEITLRCKVPPGHIAGNTDEFNLGSFEVSANINAVRERIQQQLPDNPAPSQQRILYGGRALVDNEQTLADALNVKRDPSQETYVIHLLVRSNGTPIPGPPQRVPILQSNPALQRSEHPMVPQQAQPGDPLPTIAGQQQWTSQQVPQQQHQHQQHDFRPLVDPLIAQHRRIHAQFLHNQQQHNPPIMPGVPAGIPGMHSQRPGHHAAHTFSTQSAAAHAETGQTAQHHLGPTHPTTNSMANSAPQQHEAAPHLAPGGPTSMHRPPSGQGFHVEGVGPDGQRFSVHQQTFSFPPTTGQPFSMPGMPRIPGIPVMPPFAAMAPRPTAVPSPVASAAVSQARVAADRALIAGEQVHQTLQNLLAREDFNEEQRARIQAILTDAQWASSQAAHARSALASDTMAFNAPLAPTAEQQPSFGLRQNNLLQRESSSAALRNTSDVTCYLLSAPDGPRAILYSPQHGAYHGSYAPAQPNGLLDTLAAPLLQHIARAPDAPVAVPRQAENLPNQGVEIQLPPELRQAEAPGPLQAILGHFWLLARIMIFAYFLLGSNMGWRRPLVLTVIGIGFWMIRMGLFGDGGLLRRWWDEIMQGPQPVQARPAANVADVQVAPDGAEPARPRRMPTPEEVAQRLLNQAARENVNPAANPQLHWLRERVRPTERAAALFIGSLWPGVGEAAVRAREEEERRRAEEEIATRRREEEERQRENQARDVKEGEGPSGNDKAKLEQDSAESAHDAGVENTATNTATNTA